VFNNLGNNRRQYNELRRRLCNGRVMTWYLCVEEYDVVTEVVQTYSAALTMNDVVVTVERFYIIM